MGLLNRTAQIAEEYLATVADRPRRRDARLRGRLRGARRAAARATARTPRPCSTPSPRHEPGMMATAGPRYFGFVTGGALPVTVAADWLVVDLGRPALRPRRLARRRGASRTSRRAGCSTLLGLPRDARVGFVTGATMANLVGLAAARHRVLARAGWDVEEQGLIGAPPVRVLVGDEVARLAAEGAAAARLRLGAASCGSPVDANGAMQPGPLAAALREGDGPAIVCAQAGNVNTGACDPLLPIVAAAREAGAWVHVDGAFGLWAAASPRWPRSSRAPTAPTRGRSTRTSGSTSPTTAGWRSSPTPRRTRPRWRSPPSYLLGADDGAIRRPARDVPPRPRGPRLRRAAPPRAARARRRWSSAAASTPRRLAAAMARVDGAEVLNDVVLNQVLLRFDDDDERTARGRSRRPARAARRGWAGRSGTGMARRACRSRTGRPPTRTSTASRRRCRRRSSAARAGSPVR